MPMTLSLVFEWREENGDLVKGKRFLLDPETGYTFARLMMNRESKAFIRAEAEEDESEETLTECLLEYATRIEPSVFDPP